MTVQEIIDQGLRQGDNVSPTSADYLERRRLALSFLTEQMDEVWWLRDWPWKKRSAIVTFPVGAGGIANLPIDFNSLGVYGGAYRSPDGGKLDDVPESVIAGLVAEGYETDTPRVFSIHGQDETTMIGTVRIPPNTGAVSIKLFYQGNPPELLDAGDTDGYGTSVVTTLTWDPTTETATAFAVAHGFETGQYIVIVDAGAGDFDGSWPITVTSVDFFTYLMPGASPAGNPAATATRDVSRANRGILQVPAKYHQTVLTWGVRAKLRESKGDARWQYAQEQFMKGLTHMLKEEARFQGTFRQLPSFFGDR